MVTITCYHGTQHRTPPTYGDRLRLTEDYEFACLQSCAGPLLTAYVYEYRLHLEGLRVFEFEAPDLQWLIHEAYDRNILTQENAPSLYREITAFENQYDVIIGPEIDDRSYALCHAFWAPLFPPIFLSYFVLLKLFAKGNLRRRVALKTEKAYSRLEEVRVHIISFEERKGYEELADRRVMEANQLYNNIDIPRELRYGPGFEDILQRIEEKGYSFVNLHDDEIGLETPVDKDKQS